MRILPAIDDSKCSEAAIEAVIEQARPENTEVRVLHVVEPPPLYNPALEPAWESQRQHAEKLVAKAAERLRARGLTVAEAAEQGDATSKILDMAGPGMASMPVELSAVTKDKSAELSAYERLLTDAMRGDKMLFVREDAVEEAWNIVDPILDQVSPLFEYAPGPWGPSEAARLAADLGGWNDPQPGS